MHTHSVLKKAASNIARYFTHLSLKSKIKWGLFIVLLIIFWLSLPRHLFETPTSFVITDKDGNLLNASIARDGQWRFPYNRQVPDKFAKCITTFEDKRFFYHPGVDPMAMGRAVWQNIRNKTVVSGGSTLTMQVIRMSRGSKSRNIWNKMIEAVLAVRLECSYRKKSILALYASNAPFGSNVVGLDAAAWRYYGRGPQQLSWGEMAALAVLPNAPSLVHPGKNTAELLRKRNELLDKLQANKTIDASVCELAKLEPLPGAPKPLPQLAPHLLERFKKDYSSFKKDDEDLASTGITTTIDIGIQRQVNDIILQHHRQLKANQVNNAAAMVLDIETGNVLAYVGNVYQPGDSSIESHVDVLASKRSPGSTLKPLLYAALLTEGKFLPNQLVPDIPTQINGYMPENFDLGYDGAVPANRALARSLNIPAVKMLQQYKYQRFYEVLKQCGLSTLSKPAHYYGMSLILGGCEISPFELAGVYSSMARMYLHEKQNKGLWNSADWHMPQYINKKQQAEDGIVRQTEISNRRPANALFDYPSLYHTFMAMNEVMRPGEEGLWGLFSSAQRIAWKTGTSFGFRDGWAIGFTSKYCVVVWVGNTSGEGRPGLTGINTAAPVMFEIFRLLPSAKWFNEPATGFAAVQVCRQSGYKAGADCPVAYTMIVSENAKNAPLCPYHRVVHLDRSGAYRVTENCESPAAMIHQPWFVLPPTIEYYYKQKHAEYKTLPPFMPGCANETMKPLDIVYPGEGARLYVPVDLSGEKGKTVFTATHRNSKGKLFWHLDDEFIGETVQFHQIAVNPVPGKHVLTIVDESGESVIRSFEIMEKQHP
ncbi:penicillin-binding protein 1C [Foetidibacter luteolus]|uniref:penicillin-binding protein 1C n=1 Tax=Foetidibacter luteolus TaxID=2608880 RepID=UPI00129B5D4A|nr:penicillin-binding protein 1C [Foetidibacter luteolus]